jgi:DNA-directed RNA polymerase subunit omega
MIYPPINSLLEKVDCSYTLVVEAARRARELVDGSRPLIDMEGKPVTVAINEIYEDKVKIVDESIQIQ